MALSTTARFQFRLIACHIAGVIAEAGAMPFLLAWGLELRNLVLAWIGGAVLFLAFAMAAGFIWRRLIPAHPVRWTLAAPPLLALAVYLALRALSGFEADEARTALEISAVSGICALFSSAFFVLWTAIVAAGAPRE